MDYNEMLSQVYGVVKKGTIEERIQIVQPMISVQGSKTIISNFDKFCDSIRRDGHQVAKFLYKELASSGSLDRGRLTLQTKSPLVKDKIEKYLKNFVYCSECKRPDTIIQREDRFFVIKCEACGAKRTISI
ncbi:MAG: translation initiation factor IF-2 subunit beta [Candidatus Aenigmarchaeota archaeon]|nr:translation initiation factor IF-2 subunit beta [Candidatus Aenigmarchaeota archaeon]